MKTLAISVKKFQLLVPLLLLTFGLLLFAQLASNKPANAYDSARLIDNSVFLDAKSMSASQIQNFLDARGSGIADMEFQLDCDLAGTQAKQQYQALNAPCGQKTSSANIIYYASQIYGISPRVVIATLQKEQSLITNPNPGSWEINQAMGYGCPTSGHCDDDSGFFWQVDNGTWVLRFHYERARGNNSWWYESSSWTCGSAKDNYYSPNLYPRQSVKFYDPSQYSNGVHYATINIKNAATSAMYCYTPHVFNNHANSPHPYQVSGSSSCWTFHPAAGSKGICYTGSYNFVKAFENWFGSTLSTKVEAIKYDSNTDKTGERAKIGFKLSKKPTSNVTIKYGVSSISNARVVGSPEVTITPNSWNKPSRNTITVEGLNNPDLNGTHQYRLKASRPESSDRSYSSLDADQVGHVELVQQDNFNSPNVYRLYSSELGQHFFTANRSERNAMIADGWRDEGVKFSYCYGGEQTIVRLKKGDHQRRMVIEKSREHSELLAEGFEQESVNFAVSKLANVPVYARYNENTGNMLYTTSSTEGLSHGFTDEGVAFYTCNDNHKAVYRMYRPSTGSHFFTASTRERNKAITTHGFRYENLGFYTCEGGDVDLYRLYRPSVGNHFYTTSTWERDNAVDNHGFRYEGVEFELCDDSDRNVYRLYNPTSRNHFYTTSASERDKAVSSHGFRNEGTKFRVR